VCERKICPPGSSGPSLCVCVCVCVCVRACARACDAHQVLPARVTVKDGLEVVEQVLSRAGYRVQGTGNRVQGIGYGLGQFAEQVLSRAVYIYIGYRV